MMRFYSRHTAIIFAATLLLASLAFTFAHAQTPATPPQQEPARPPVETPTPTPPADAPKNAAEQDEEVEQVETNIVNILFNAVDKNRRFVTTLRSEDVEVFENDVRQNVSYFQRETELPLSLAILIDVSASQERTLPDEQAAAHIFIDSVIRPDKDKAAIISFTGDATVEQDMTDNRVRLNLAIGRVEIAQPPSKDEAFVYDQAEREAERTGIDNNNPGLRGSTAMWDAIWATATDLLSRTPERTRRAIILLSDGADSTSRIKRDQAVEAVIAANAVVYSIGIGDSDFDEGALKKVSERTGGHAFFPENEAQLNAAFAQIQQE
ncbi:MAG TPA: VWA domain-containing protein, partial [Pyrinomonadaceae bacterium]|nr:VWA domain-containing protein [Pyrinomonadaceae bacterium]